MVVGLICYLIAPAKTPYIKLLAALPILWGLRLSLYLGKRNLGHGEDPRYVAMLKRAEKKGLSEKNWRDRSLVTIYFGQGLLIMIVSAPIWVAMGTGTIYQGIVGHSVGKDITLRTTTDIGLFAILGALLWFIGFLFEAIGDWQLSRFLKKNKNYEGCLLYTSPSPRDGLLSRMPSSA